jgi:acyl dehydratase
MKTYSTPADVLDAVGTELGASEWLAIDQDRVTAFAHATNDLQWIHVDPERAASGPFGGTIAHGYLTLALIPFLTSTLLTVNDVALVVNYGLDRVRFVQAVRVGSRVRAAGKITSAETTSRGVQVGIRVTISIEGKDKPALIADTISLLVPEETS